MKLIPTPKTKEEVIASLKEAKKFGWIKNTRPGNNGGIGNTLEDVTGIPENNLPIPNAAEWELKSQRLNARGTAPTSLTTLFHFEPSPTALRLVSSLLLPKYGWPHQGAGTTHSIDELSFRQTINAKAASDRGFRVVINREVGRVEISFDASRVAAKHAAWLQSVQKRVGNLDQLKPQPYWGFADLRSKAGTKLINCFYVLAKTRKQAGEEYYLYDQIYMLREFDFDKLLAAFEQGKAFVDFDARSGHNHGTKIRLSKDILISLYKYVDVLE